MFRNHDLTCWQGKGGSRDVNFQKSGNGKVCKSRIPILILKFRENQENEFLSGQSKLREFEKSTIKRKKSVISLMQNQVICQLHFISCVQTGNGSKYLFWNF
ncbi:hypothetical protein HOLleu_43559 [Holothuria leucospilota]|uniref:Uncharacterized protein n=1 Tax=Holothuria leucospilota TaxID=206669 RepID=A0A9Q0YBS7_HOLLE|nr:hypothetical protein HOLleu_43559 [Holothuria leucospilota]